MFEYFYFGDIEVSIQENNDNYGWRITIEDKNAPAKIVFQGIASYKEALKIAKRFCESKIKIWKGLLKQIEEELNEQKQH